MFKNKNLIKVLAATVLIGMSFTSCTHLIEKIKDLAGGDDDGYENTDSGNSGQSTNKKNNGKSTAVALTSNTWKYASITGSEAWFSFTPNSSIQNIFIKDNTSSLTVAVYDYTDNSVVTFTVDSYTKNKVYTSYSTYSTYYIKVSGSGSFSIGYTSTPAQPGTVITTLDFDEWKLSTSSNTENWFKFTSSSYSGYYIWLYLTSYSPDLRVSVFDSDCKNVNDYNYNNSYTVAAPYSDPKEDSHYYGYLNSYSTYYIKVERINSSGSSYKIAVNTSSYAPSDYN